MKLCLAADLHGHLPVVPDCDLLILAGDYAPHIESEDWWLQYIFTPWLIKLSHRMPVVGIAGNHDWAFTRHYKPDLPWTYLQDSETTVGGLRIWGTPWQPKFNNWAFNLDEKELSEKHAMIPDGIDVIVSHGPPYGLCDGVVGKGHLGSASLLRRVREVRPQLVVCGHIHEGHGIMKAGYHEDDIIVVNCTIVDAKYQPVHQVWEYEI